MLEHLVDREGAGAGLVAVVGHENDEVVLVRPLHERCQLPIEQAVDVAHAVGDRRGGDVLVAGMPRMDVLEQAVLEPVGRDEDHARGVPRLLVHERAHRSGALAGEPLEIGDELERPLAERRPRASVDRPAQPGAHVLGVAERSPGRHDAPRDGDPTDLRRRVREGNVDEEGRLARLGESVRPGRRQDRTVGDRQPPRGPGPVLEDVEDAVPARVSPGEEGRPGRPGVGREARARDTPSAAADQPLQRGQLAGGEQRVEDVPVGAVPADDEHAVGHGRGGYRERCGTRVGRGAIYTRCLLHVPVANQPTRSR